MLDARRDVRLGAATGAPPKVFVPVKPRKLALDSWVLKNRLVLPPIWTRSRVRRSPSAPKKFVSTTQFVKEMLVSLQS